MVGVRRCTRRTWSPAACLRVAGLVALVLAAAVLGATVVAPPPAGARSTPVEVRAGPGLRSPEAAELERAGAFGGHPVRLLLVGDSIALTLGMGLSVDAPARYGVDVVDQATIGCDLDPESYVYLGGQISRATQGCMSWRALWPFLVAAERPQVVAFGLGRWEAADHLYDDRWAHVGEPLWDAHLAGELDDAVSILHSFGARVVLFTMPYVDPTNRQPDGLPWPEDEPSRARAYNAVVRQVARANRPRRDRARPQRDAEPPRRLHPVARGRHRADAGRHPYQRGRRRAAAAPDPAHGGPHRHGGRSGGRVRSVTDQDAAEAPPAELVVESVPAAMAFAPNAVGPNLGAEILLDREGRPGVESMRAGLLQAGPLAAAGVLANGASVVLTIALARLLVPHSYGVLNQLTGLYLILSMPGSAVVVAVVRRVTMWHEDGSGHLVRRWAGRVHRQGTVLVLVWAAVVFASRHDVAVLLNQQSGIGIAAILTAAAFFVLLSLDRGLLQAHRSYQPLAANLLVEMGVRVAAVLALVAAGFGPSGAAVGVLMGEVVAAGHARWAAGARLVDRRACTAAMGHAGAGSACPASRPRARRRLERAPHRGPGPGGGLRVAVHGGGAAEHRRAGGGT